MSKQILEIDVDDFAQLISCVGYVITLVGLAIPDSPQKALAIRMGDDLIDMMLKYSSDEKREHLEHIREMIITAEADTSVSH